MKRTLVAFIGLFIIISILAPESGMHAAQLDVDDPTEIYLPLILKNWEADPEPIIPETTEVLTEETTQYLSSISPDGVTFTFSQGTPELDDIEPDDVIVGDVSDAATYGFLRKVVSVSSQNGQVIIETESATLEDAIQQGAIHISKQLTPADIQTVTARPGVMLVNDAGLNLDDSFFFEINNVVLYDDDGNHSTTYDQLKVNGSLELAPGFHFDAFIQDWTVEELEFVFTAEEIAELEFQVEVDVVNLEVSYELARLHLGTITFLIGPVPVVFLIEMPIYLRGDGEVSVGITTSVTQQAKLSGGLRYDGANWSPIASLDNGFGFEPPMLSAGANFKGYIDPPLMLMLYGIAGPFAAANPYLKVEADIFSEPWWQLYAGIDVNVGVEVEVLGNSLGNHTEIVIGYEILLAQANIPPNEPTNPTPIDHDINQSLDIDLSWTGDDPDGDTVTYDVYFEANNTPDLLVSDDQSETNYDPGTLSPGIHYYWKIVAKDEHDAITDGPIWDFTTMISNQPPYTPYNPNPADGATNQSVVVTLTWSGGDPDSDLVTYDVYFEANDSTPDVLVSNDQYGTIHDPGILNPNTHYYWKIISKDEHGAITNGPVWNFTTEDNTIPDDMVFIPAGEFQMGCDPDHNDGYNCEQFELPLHTVYLDAYQIDKFEVTNAQYTQCVAADRCTAPKYNFSYNYSPYYDNPTYADYPVIHVDWDQASAYCDWAGKRLPTEAEWEKAARGTTDTRTYPWGDQTLDCNLANFGGPSGCVGDTSQVGDYPAGASIPYGVLDLAGNVFEWVNDWYLYNYYSTYPYSNPPGPITGTYKVLRGGSWIYSVTFLRVAARSVEEPSYSSDFIGFRCAADAP